MTNEERAAIEAEIKQIEEVERLERVSRQRQIGKQASDGMSNFENFGLGIAKSAIETGLGIKDLFTDLTPEEQDELERLAGIDSGYATAGNVTGDVASALLPVGAIGNVLTKVATKAPKLLAKATPLLADLTGSALLEASKAETEGVTRGERAQESIEGTLAAAIGLKGLQQIAKVVKPKGFTPKEGAQELQDKGVRLTPAQKYDSRLLEAGEQFMGVLPFANKGVDKLKNQSLDDWNASLMNQVNPVDAPISGVGANAFKELQGNFKQAYDDVWQGVEPQNFDVQKVSDAFNSALSNVENTISTNSVVPVRQQLTDAANSVNQFLKTGNTRFLESADDALRAKGAAEYGTDDFLKGVRSEFRSSLPDGAGDLLTKVDDKYAQYKVLEDAATSTKDAVLYDTIDPSNLIGSVKKQGQSRQLSTGESLLQDEAVKAAQILGKSRPEKQVLRKTLGGMGTIGAGAVDPLSTTAAIGAGSVLATEPVRKAFTETIPELIANPDSLRQQALANALRGGNKVKAAALDNMGVDEINRLIRQSGGAYGAQDD